MLNSHIIHVHPAHSTPGPIRVYIDPPTILNTTLTPGEEFTVDFRVENVENLWGYKFWLSFNPDVIHGVSVENGPFLGKDAPPQKHPVMVNPGPGFDNEVGELKLFGAYLLFEVEPPEDRYLADGNGVLAAITFEVVGTGVSNITLGPPEWTGDAFKGAPSLANKTAGFLLSNFETGEWEFCAGWIEEEPYPGGPPEMVPYEPWLNILSEGRGYFTNEGYTLAIGSTPITGIEFTLNDEPCTTNFTGYLPLGSYTINMSTSWTVDDKDYDFLRWENGSMNAIRVIELTEDTSLTATYIETGAEYTLAIESTPIGGVNFTLDDEPYQTPFSESLPPGSYTINMPTHWSVNETVYEFLEWNMTDDPTNPTRDVSLTHNMSLTATYIVAEYTLTIESTPIGGVNFTLDDEPYQTPFSESLPPGSYTINMSLGWEVSGAVFKFVAWEDAPTADSLRVIELMSDVSLSATYIEVAEYSLTIDSVTIDGTPMTGVTFTLKFPNSTVKSYETPFNETLSAEKYTVTMPDEWTVSETGYAFLAWRDLVDTPERTFILGSDTSLTAIYMPGEEEYKLEIDATNAVDSTPMQDMDFKLNGSDQITPFSSVPLLKAGNHVVQMHPEWEDGGIRYWFVRWSDTGSKNPTRAVALTSNMSLTAVYANLSVYNVNKETYYEKIQWAIGNASADDTIEVYPNIYHENLQIDKPLELLGKDPHTTVVDGGGGSEVIYVTADSVTVSGFTLQNSSWIGIYVEGVTGCTIGDNIMSDCADGIGLWMCEYTTISSNIVKASDYPMWLDTSNNNIVYGNTITLGVWEGGLTLWGSNNNTIYGNTVSNSSVGGLVLWDSHDNTIYHNNFLDNALTKTVKNATSFQENNGWISPENAYSSDNIYANATVEGANVTYFGYGLTPIEYLWGSVQARIMKLEVGIEAFGSDGDDYIQVQVSWNNGANWTSLFSYVPATSDSNTTVYMDVTSGRTWTWDELSDGNFLVRTFKRTIGDENVTCVDRLPVRVTSVLQAYDDGDSFWDDDYPSGGNYWSDYTGVDDDGDGMGDSAYEIPDNSTDRYPLMNPWPMWFPVVWDDVIYQIRIASNSTITALKFSQEDKQISFNVTGSDGTTGFCKVHIPKDLLDVLDKWIVLVDGNNVTDEVTVVSGSILNQLYFTYSHSTQKVEIEGTIVIDNIPPVANAEQTEPRTVDEDTGVVAFDGTASWDDIGIKNYTWTFEEEGASTVLVGETVDHTFGDPGFYFVTLEVTDWRDNSDTDTVLITVRDKTPPTADAGPDQTVDEDTLVFFDGSNSTDNVPNGIVSYLWTFPDKTKDGKTVTHTFETPPGPYPVTLKVTDAAGNSDTDTVSVTVTDTTKPVANASKTTNIVREDTELTLDGSASSDNVEVVEHEWYVEDVPPQTLSGEIQAYKGWATPGVYNVTLKVWDAADNWNTTQLDITVLDITKPEADAGPTQIVDEDTVVTLDGSASSDNDPFHDLSYVWTFFNGTLNVTLTGVKPTYNFTSPGDYTVTLNVTDAAGNWDTDKTIIMVRDATAPRAFADVSPSDTVNEGTQVTFNGSASTDNIRIESYTWTFTDQGILQSLDGAIANYTFENPGVYPVTLMVTDDEGKSDTDSVVITVLDITAPVANAGLNQTVDEDTVVMLDGSASRDNVAIESYTWVFTENGKLRTLTGVSPNYIFVAPSVYVVTLNVTDAAGNSAVDEVEITVYDVTAPMADAGSDQTVNAETSVTLDGSASTDNVGIESYVWTFMDGNTSQTLTGVNPNYTFAEPGEYTVTLTVTDGAENFDTDIVAISVLPGSGSLPIWDIALIALAGTAIAIGIASFMRKGSKS